SNSAASHIKAFVIRADGSLPSLRGNPKLALGVERRQETLNRTLLGRDLLYHPQHFGRYITGAFMELSAPLMDARHLTGAYLELSVAARYERYSDFGDTFNPKLGIRWMPTDFVKLRTSWGSSFKAP